MTYYLVVHTGPCPVPHCTAWPAQSWTADTAWSDLLTCYFRVQEMSFLMLGSQTRSLKKYSDSKKQKQKQNPRNKQKKTHTHTNKQSKNKNKLKEGDTESCQERSTATSLRRCEVLTRCHAAHSLHKATAPGQPVMAPNPPLHTSGGAADTLAMFR